MNFINSNDEITLSNFRTKKLALFSFILFLGFAFSCFIHFILYPKIGLDKYPFSTYLGLETLKFGDFYETCDRSLSRAPYSLWTLYFPTTFVVFKQYCKLNIFIPREYHYFIFVFLVSLGTTVTSYFFFNRDKSSTLFFLLCCAFSYPLQYAINRGNIEYLIFLILLIALYLKKIEKIKSSIFLVSLIASMKGIPGIFLSLFTNEKKRLKTIIFCIITFFLLVFIGFINLHQGFLISVQGLVLQHQKFNQDWALGLDGLVRSNSFYSMIKIISLSLGLNLDTSNFISNIFNLTLNFSLFSFLFILLIDYKKYFIRNNNNNKLSLIFLTCCLIFVFFPKVSNDYKAIIFLLFPLTLSLEEWIFFKSNWATFWYCLILIPKNFLIIQDAQLKRYDENLKSFYSDISVGALLTPIAIIALYILFVTFKFNANHTKRVVDEE